MVISMQHDEFILNFFKYFFIQSTKKPILRSRCPKLSLVRTKSSWGRKPLVLELADGAS